MINWMAVGQGLLHITSSQTIRRGGERNIMMILDVDNLYRKYKCLKPCTYMEYKVMLRILFFASSPL